MVCDEVDSQKWKYGEGKAGCEGVVFRRPLHPLYWNGEHSPTITDCRGQVSLCSYHQQSGTVRWHWCNSGVGLGWLPVLTLRCLVLCLPFPAFLIRVKSLWPHPGQLCNCCCLHGSCTPSGLPSLSEGRCWRLHDVTSTLFQLWVRFWFMLLLCNVTSKIWICLELAHF